MKAIKVHCSLTHYSSVFLLFLLFFFPVIAHFLPFFFFTALQEIKYPVLGAQVDILKPRAIFLGECFLKEKSEREKGSLSRNDSAHTKLPSFTRPKPELIRKSRRRLGDARCSNAAFSKKIRAKRRKSIEELFRNIRILK